MAALTNPLTPARSAELLDAYHVSTTRGLKIRDGKELEKQAYVEVAEHLLDREIQAGKLEAGDQNRIDLNIELRMGVARYVHPDTNEEHVIDLLDLEEGATKEAFDAYVEAAEAKSEYLLSLKVRAHSKGNSASREVPLKRDTQHLRALPNGQSHAYEALMPKLLREQTTREERIGVSTRLHFVEFMRRKMLQDLNKRIGEKDGEFAGLAASLREHPENNRHLEALRKEIERLRALREDLEGVDYHALGHLLAAYPLDGSRPIALTKEKVLPMLTLKRNEVDGRLRAETDEAKRKELQAEVQHLTRLVSQYHQLDIYTLTRELARYPLDDHWLKDLAPVRKLVGDLTRELQGNLAASKGVFQKGKEFFGFAKDDLTQKDIAYIKDVVGMLYTTRWDYEAYCSSHGLTMKKEGVADILFREAVAYAADEHAHDGEEFAASTLGESFEENFFSEMSRLATWEIGTIKDNWYHMPPEAAGLPPDAQKALDQQRETELRRHLKEQYDRISWDSTVGDIPVDDDRSFGRRHWRPIVGAGAAAAAAVAYAGGYGPAIASAASSALSAAGSALAGASPF